MVNKDEYIKPCLPLSRQNPNKLQANVFDVYKFPSDYAKMRPTRKKVKNRKKTFSSSMIVSTLLYALVFSAYEGFAPRIPPVMCPLCPARLKGLLKNLGKKILH